MINLFLLLFFEIFKPSTHCIVFQNAITAEAIPYVTYINLQTSKGGYANENGQACNIEFNTVPFVVSCIGYKTDTVFFKTNVVQLQPIIYELPETTIKGNFSKPKKMNIGYFKRSTLKSFASVFKHEYYTYIKNPDSSKTFHIKSIKLALNGQRKSGFYSFKIRPIIKSVYSKLPKHDLLLKDMVVEVFKGANSVEIHLPYPLILPNKGCFVGFETIGYSITKDSYIPFSDFSVRPKEEVLVSIPIRKSDSKSYWNAKKEGRWYGSVFAENDVFAFGLVVTY